MGYKNSRGTSLTLVVKKRLLWKVHFENFIKDELNGRIIF